MRTSLKFALAFAGYVIRPLPDRWRTFRLVRSQRQGPDARDHVRGADSKEPRQQLPSDLVIRNVDVSNRKVRELVDNRIESAVAQYLSFSLARSFSCLRWSIPWKKRRAHR
jgi:hypothetical protein